MRAVTLLALLAFASTAPAQDDALGRTLYQAAIRPGGEPLTALVGYGQTPIAGAAVACGNCHGADGKGRPEGGVLPPEIRWQELTKPYGHAHATGRRHGPFSLGSFLRAVNEGVDPAGNRLDPAMPRYSLSHSEAEALVGYLERLAGEREPGVGEDRVRIGVLLPAGGGRAGAAMQAALAAHAASLESSGGIHQRRIELVVAHGLDDAHERFAAQPVFAVLKPPGFGDRAALDAFVTASRLPVVGSLAGMADDVGESNPLVFSVLPGRDEEAAVLVEFAKRRAGSAALRAAVVASGAPSDERAAQAALRRCASRKCGDIVRIGWYARRFDAAGAVRRLRGERRQHVFFFGSGDELMALLEETVRSRGSRWRPTIYAPGALARVAAAAGAQFAGELYLAFPESPAAAPGAWQQLSKAYGLSEQYPGAQIAALAAAVVLTEGLRRAGRDLTRERFVEALETLNHYDPMGYAPAVSFGPDRRTGALGGYVVAIDPQHGFAPASGWIALD